ncbi:MAG: phenylalanine 4-monooxygenase [Bacteroidetes bacterium]|nr:MAG: phenylalanine 4-monooxygenase [Bacteroidota bacterium]TAG90074.1 MAG: phenylalanine 4-monooxygenase [Bacteroidota bacterium]
MNTQDNVAYHINENGYYIYDISGAGLKQNYGDYTTDDHQVWQTLYERQMENLLGGVFTSEYIKGLEMLGFDSKKIANFEDINQLLKQASGWSIYVVLGLIPIKEFFELMKNQKFCATTWLRKKDQLDYLEEPDMFHDVFGHVPLLTNKPLCNFIQGLSNIALKYIDNQYIIDLIGRIYWFTIEFGLVKENDILKIYGAGIISSAGETDYSLNSPIPQRVPYSVEEMLNTPFHKDHYQTKYFVLDSFEQLENSIPEIDEKIAKIHQDMLVKA